MLGNPAQWPHAADAASTPSLCAFPLPLCPNSMGRASGTKPSVSSAEKCSETHSLLAFRLRRDQ